MKKWKDSSYNYYISMSAERREKGGLGGYEGGEGMKEGGRRGKV